MEYRDSISYCTARNFLTHYTNEELATLPIDSSSAAPTEVKLTLLLSLLQKKLSSASAAVAPMPLYEADYSLWRELLQSIFTYQEELGMPEAEATIREMVDRRPDRDSEKMTMGSVITLHMFADFLVKTGKCEEAERVERKVCAFMDASHLGKYSPQAINARRIIARALWGQGEEKRGEAEAMVQEIEELTEGMGGGKYAVYQEEERSLNEKMKSKLGA